MAPVVVDAMWDIEPVVTMTTIVVVVETVGSVGPILPVCATVVTVEVLVMALMSMVDSVPVVLTTMRLDGCGEDQREQERAAGKGDLGDAFHGKASFNAPGVLPEPGQRLALIRNKLGKLLKII